MNLLAEHASFSHSAILNVFTLLFQDHESLADRLRNLHQNVLSRPSPVNDVWLAKYAQNRECFAKEANQLVLYALAHHIDKWSPALFVCMSRTLMTFSHMTSLERYAESLGLEPATLEESKRKELEDQIKFVQNSYPEKLQTLLRELIADYQRLHPTTDEAEATVSMAGAGAPVIEGAVATEIPTFPLGLHRLYDTLSSTFYETIEALKLAEVSTEDIFQTVEANLAKIRKGHELALVIRALGGKDMKPEHETQLLTEAFFEKIQDGHELAQVIRALGGKDMKSEHGSRLLPDAFLSKIRGINYALASVIEALGGKDMKSEHEAFLLTDAFFEKIQDGGADELFVAAIIKALGGKDMKSEHGSRLLTDGFLAEMRNIDQLATVIQALGGKNMKSEHVNRLLTDAFLAKIRHGEQLPDVILALGGKDMKFQHATRLFTESILAKIQDAYELINVIKAVGGKDMTPEMTTRLLTESVLANIRYIGPLIDVINALGGKDMKPEIATQLFTKSFLRNINDHQLSSVIETLGGKDMKPEIAARLLTDSILEKIQNGNQLRNVIKALGRKDMNPEIAARLLTDSVLKKIQNGDQLRNVIKALGGKDMNPEIAARLLTHSVLKKIQNGDQLSIVIGACGGEEMKPEIAARLLTHSVLKKTQNRDQLVSIIRHLGGRGISIGHKELLIKEILLPKAAALQRDMGFFARRKLRGFIAQCNIDMARHTDISAWQALFLQAAKEARLVGPTKPETLCSVASDRSLANRLWNVAHWKSFSLNIVFFATGDFLSFGIAKKILCANPAP